MKKLEKEMQVGKQQGKVLSIKIPDEESNGVYSNFALISHKEWEFCMDFLFIKPARYKTITSEGERRPDDSREAEVRARIITTPDHAKRVLAALMDNVRRYEQTFGPINLEEEEESVSASLGSKGSNLQ